MPTQSSITDLQQIASLRRQLLAIRLDAGRRRDQMRSLEEIIREEREQAWKHAKRSRGGYIPTKEQIIQEEREEALRKGKGRRGKGKACGAGWIRPDYECRRDWGGLQQRLDDLAARMDKAKNCVKGISCGSTCIPKGRTCKEKATPAAAKLEEMVKAGPGAGAGGAAAPAAKTPVKKAASPAKAAAKAAAPASDEVAAMPDGKKVGKKQPTAQEAKQIAALEAKVATLKQKNKGANSTKYLDKLLEAEVKLSDLKLKATDPAAFAERQAEKAAREAARAKEEAAAKAAKDKWQVTQNKLDARQDAARSKLSQRELQAIADYTDEGGDRPFHRLNDCARKTPCRDREARQHMKELDSALKKLPSNIDGDTFYRGVGVIPGEGSEKLYKMLEKAKPGTKLKDPGFGSYSSDRSVAKGFMGDETNILFVSRSTALKPINRFSEIPPEYEALMPRGTTTTIRKVTKDGDILIVEID